MIGRHQLPAYSPMTVGALFAGLRGALGRASSDAMIIADRFRSEWEVRDLLLTNSGTAALTLALRATAGGTSRPVALPAYCCYDIATAAIGADVGVVLYDIDPATLSPQPESLKRALATNPAAVVVVHLFGLPVDVDAIAAEAGSCGAIVIEDAAQAFGATIRGRPAGTLGSLSILSFGRGKGFTGGSGGCLLANDAAGVAALERARVDLHSSAGWKQLAIASGYWMFARPSLYWLPIALPFLRMGETIFRPPRAVRGLSRVSALILNELWSASEESARVRLANTRELLRCVESTNSLRAVHASRDFLPSYLRLPVRSEKRERDDLIGPRERRMGMAPGYPRPLNQLRGFADRCQNGNEFFGGAELLANKLFTLPTHELLSEKDLQRIVRWLAR